MWDRIKWEVDYLVGGRVSTCAGGGGEGAKGHFICLNDYLLKRPIFRNFSAVVGLEEYCTFNGNSQNLNVIFNKRILFVRDY